ncbi:MAG: hypothetical protein WDA59_04010 [Methanofastidiosum sp.]
MSMGLSDSNVELAEELEKTEMELLAKLPCNPNSKQNQKLADGLEKELKEYFTALGVAFPYDKLQELYYRLVKE